MVRLALHPQLCSLEVLALPSPGPRWGLGAQPPHPPPGAAALRMTPGGFPGLSAPVNQVGTGGRVPHAAQRTAALPPSPSSIHAYHRLPLKLFIQTVWADKGEEGD